MFNKKDESAFREDDKLFYWLKNDGIQITEKEIRKAKKNDGETLYNIGRKYFKKENYFKALAWFFKGAAQNNSGSQNHIGYMYGHGLGVNQDYKKAMEWYLKAVKNDEHSDAHNNIGFLYQHGLGVPLNYHLALGFYLKAVSNEENELAQNNIGSLYYEGTGVPKNIHTAIEWFTRSANRGYPLSQYWLGWIYEKEEEFGDLEKSVKWYKKAADSGHKDAIADLDRLTKQGVLFEKSNI